MILGVVVGLATEARLLRRLGTLGPAVLRVAVSGATATGAARASALLAAGGATHLLSFGLAAGLDPALEAGQLLLPAEVLAGCRRHRTDPALRAWLGDGLGGPLLHSDRLVAAPADKAALRTASGCIALDMESGAVARAAEAAGLPFAVLRAVCDGAARTLPPAACIALRPGGRLDGRAILASMLRRPTQLPGLLALGRDAGRAKAALARRLDGLATPTTIG